MVVSRTIGKVRIRFSAFSLVLGLYSTFMLVHNPQRQRHSAVDNRDVAHIAAQHDDNQKNTRRENPWLVKKVQNQVHPFQM